MAVLDEAHKLASAGRMRDAVELVARAAAAGDAEALWALANWRLFGLNGPRDAGAAHALLDKASALGHVESIRLKATLVINGTGCRSDPDAGAAMLGRIAERDDLARQQLDLASRMPGDREVERLPVELLSERPTVRVVRRLLSPDECGYLIAMAEPNLTPSTVVDPRTGGRMPHPFRTSEGTSFGPSQEDLVVHLINRRLAQVTRTMTQCGEPLHMLRYAPGQEYRPHSDALPGVVNQRQWTVLMYLNEGYSGGATRFDLADIEFAGRTGDALIFRNVDAAGKPDPLTLHAGTPVTRGTKWLATRWIRTAAYHPWQSV